MSTVMEGFRFAWNKNLEYGPKLVADLEEADMVAQPAPEGGLPANHPAWVLSHLNVYHPVIEAILQRQSFEDPREHPFGMLSRPEPDRSLYPSRDELVETFVEGHRRIDALLAEADDSVLSESIKLPRWEKVMPSAAVALPYLMFNHENIHLGQVSAWRRIQGLPSV